MVSEATRNGFKDHKFPNWNPLVFVYRYICRVHVHNYMYMYITICTCISWKRVILKLKPKITRVFITRDECKREIASPTHSAKPETSYWVKMS